MQAGGFYIHVGTSEQSVIKLMGQVKTMNVHWGMMHLHNFFIHP